ncbi:hypothetical protein OHB41_34165 [Streptomyces sp. NBC_01571]|uniref:hypothetical protein n=1 Tax=Streptomyces sp. NBC_01571 TaxID=2975883 RepID=UPI00225976D8|nr:hypothetical protein [Streptomyces sp. NBC_01571]MCX4578149.1 hypothetical protein [Streptomyces sp. NBC_01571]
MSTTVQPTPPHASAAKQSPSDEMTDRILTASRAKTLHAIPDAVRKAAAETGFCTPEQADQIAATMVAKLSQPAKPALTPDVERALAQIEIDKQTAKDAGLWDENYERVLNTLGDMFREANDVDSVLEVCIGAMVTAIAQDHGMRVVRANESADDQLHGQITVWPRLVVLPHAITALDALDQLRGALDEKAGE